MGDIKINEKTLFSQSGSAEPSMGSTITDIPAAGVTGTLVNAVQDNITRLGTVTTGTIGGSTAINNSGSITTSGGMTVDGATVFNEASADVDFRVEGNGDANLIFADASTDRVGIGCADPQDNLEVRSSAGAHFRVDGDSATSVGVKVRNNYDAGSGAVQSEWTLAAGGGTSEFGVYNLSLIHI